MTTHATTPSAATLRTASLAPPPRVPSLAELRPTHWHRPLVILAGAMGVLTILSVVGVLFDAREVTNAAVWMKPLKFAISIGIYSLTLAWLIGRLPAGSRIARVASVAGTITAIGLAIELVIIDGFALFGDTSHFNVSTPFHAAMWSVMAVSISVVWVMSLLVAALLFRAPLGDSARSLAIRAGAVIALVGMAIAFLMTGPMPGQISDYTGVIGAHTVGLADGGPGLLFLGWSTVAGDLRVPHFIGMHALQALPLFVLVLELLARRMPALQDQHRRFRLVLVAVITFSIALLILTVQALLGQSVVAPSPAIATVGIALAAVTIAAATAIMVAPAGRSRQRPSLPKLG